MVASIRIDLTVDRADGEVVGALGACWDPHNQTWFLDAGVELAPFATWLPAAGRVEPSAQVPSTPRSSCLDRSPSSSSA